MRKNVFLNRTYFGDHKIYTIGRLGPVSQIGDYYFELSKEGKKLLLSIRDLKLNQVLTRTFSKGISCKRVRIFAENFAKTGCPQKAQLKPPSPRLLDPIKRLFKGSAHPLEEGRL